MQSKYAHNASVPMLQCLRAQRKQVSIEPASATVAGSLFQERTEFCIVECFSRFMRPPFSLNLCRCEAWFFHRLVSYRGFLSWRQLPHWWPCIEVPDVVLRAVLRVFVDLIFSQAGWCCIPAAAEATYPSDGLALDPFDCLFLCPHEDLIWLHLTRCQI